MRERFVEFGNRHLVMSQEGKQRLPEASLSALCAVFDEVDVGQAQMSFVAELCWCDSAGFKSHAKGSIVLRRGVSSHGAGLCWLT